MRKWKTLTVFLTALSSFLVGAFAIIFVSIDLYRENVIVRESVTYLEEKGSKYDENVFNVFYDLSSLNYSLFSDSNRHTIEESPDPEKTLMDLFADSGLISGLYYGVSAIINDQTEIKSSSALPALSDAIRVAMANAGINRMVSFPSFEYNGNYYLVTSIKTADVVASYFINPQFIMDVPQVSLDSHATSLVLDSDLSVYFSTDQSYLGKVFFSDLLPNSKDYGDVWYGNNHFFVVRNALSKASNFGTTLSMYTIVDYDYLFEKINAVETATLAAVGGTFAVAFAISVALVGALMRPIKELSAKVKAVDLNGDRMMASQPTSLGNSEIQVLEDNFQAMLARIKKLMQEQKDDMEEQRKLELESLQIQINPHFLYNSLDAVAWMAKMDNDALIERFVISLANFYRTSLHKGAKYIKVSEEVDIVRYYLEIEKVRSPSLFEYELAVGDSVKDLRVIKLLLQPFVENVIKHAFADIDYKGKIKIAAIKSGDKLKFTIGDNGCGFNPKTINLTSSQINESRKGGYGIRNVNERLKLEYGEGNYALAIKSRKGKGTTVTIYLSLSCPSLRKDGKEVS